MRKYYLRYLIFLVPALAISLICDNPFLYGLFFEPHSMLAIILRWLFAFFMITGFGVTTYTAAYRFPRSTLSLIMCYTGANLLITTILYASRYGTLTKNIMQDYAGATSYVPLSIVVEALLAFNINQEVYVILIIAGSMLIGYLAGIISRRVHPYPYRPRIG